MREMSTSGNDDSFTVTRKKEMKMISSQNILFSISGLRLFKIVIRMNQTPTAEKTSGVGEEANTR
jgi:hypothetical protein